MQLKTLLYGISEGNFPNIDVKTIQQNSKNINKGDVFVAVAGNEHDGRNYINDAIKRGASAVLVEAIDVLKFNFNANTVPIIKIKNLRDKIGMLAYRLYLQNKRQIPLIAITGTNGKTSVSHYISQILSDNNFKTGVIGTIGVGFSEKLEVSSLTTPDCISMHKFIANFIDQGAKALTLEASSHALMQDRLAYLDIDTAVFTNLSQDHLDYHKTIENYFNAKKKLFFDFNAKNFIINIDDVYGNKILEELKSTVNKKVIFTYSINDENADISVIKASYSILGTYAKIKTPLGVIEINTKLIGAFNLSNLLASIGACICIIQNYNNCSCTVLDNILEAVNNLKPVSGRMMTFKNKQKGPCVIVDYAHTPDALEKVLTALSKLEHSNLWCVFGCGGDRDRDKRPQMLQAVQKFSDKIIITNDNPRTEDPCRIIADILSIKEELRELFFTGKNNGELLSEYESAICNKSLLYISENISVELNREKAIQTAISQASCNDIVLVAGKGHEDYQIIGSTKLPFSDINLVKKALSLSF